jgi:hypothetical protein
MLFVEDGHPDADIIYLMKVCQVELSLAMILTLFSPPFLSLLSSLSF